MWFVCEEVEWKFPFPFILENFSPWWISPRTWCGGSAKEEKKKSGERERERAVVKRWNYGKYANLDFTIVSRDFSAVRERRGGDRKRNWKMLRKKKTFTSLVRRVCVGSWMDQGPESVQFSSLSANDSIACTRLNFSHISVALKWLKISIKNRHRARLSHKEWGEIVFLLFFFFLQLLYHIHARNISSFYACMSTEERKFFFFLFAAFLREL